MSEPSNAFEPRFDGSGARPGFAARRARLGRQAGAERIGMSLYEVEPGSAPFPLHYHLANEELLLVIAGRPSLRTLDSERELEPGEVVGFPQGESGVHQVVNRTDAAVRVLLVSEMNSPDIVVRPESGKLSAFGRAPGAEGPGMHQVFFARDAVTLWDGEDPPPATDDRR